MGLDMYLRAEQYVGGWKHGSDEETALYHSLLKEVGLEGFGAPDSPSLTINVTVAYWRKANQIHKWFVDNVQDGEDECRPHDVSRQDLRDLLALCKRVLAEKDLVPATLPPQPGFFFGAYEVDEWYWADINSTIEQLERVLRLPDNVSFVYQSSW